VIHRCAWCGQLADASGTYTVAPTPEPTRIVSDGMCPTCGAAELARIGQRRRRAA
jgi:hypothetical protein